MNREQIFAEINDLQETQAYKRTFDFVARFTAKANTADAVTIPINNAGAFKQLGYNIKYTKNSTLTRGGNTTNICAVKLKMRSQAANNTQSNDFVPVQLIATPGGADMPRYGTRPFMYVYPKGDALVIEYDNRAPAALVTGDTYTMKDEQIEICFNGYLYVID
jgi:hypothetical protein